MTRWMNFAAFSLLLSCGSTTQAPENPEASSSENAPGQQDGDPSTSGGDDAQQAQSASAEQEMHPPDGPAGRVPRRPGEGASLDEVMRVHFKDANIIRQAVIAGRPEDSGAPAESLLHLFEVKDLPPSWVEPVARLQKSALRVKDSSDIAGVAAATADIGTSCGWCHQKLGGPRPEQSTPPADDGTVPGRMRRHAWATERLWEGLYVPSSDAWEAGTRVLADAPFPDAVLKKGGVYAKGAARDFHRLVLQAPKKRGTEERAALYAELLGTCATCHTAMK